MKMIKFIGRFATRRISPDLTFLFDIEVKKGLSRTGKVKDRIERRPFSYHQRVRRGYLSLARQEPRRIKVIKVNKNKEEIFERVRGYVDHMLRIK
jgi:dTMP kinase